MNAVQSLEYQLYLLTWAGPIKKINPFGIIIEKVPIHIRVNAYNSLTRMTEMRELVFGHLNEY